MFMYIIGEKISLNFNLVFRKNRNKIQISKMMFAKCFKSSRLNIMHIIFLPQQVGWLGGRRANLHPWGSRINPHK